MDVDFQWIYGLIFPPRRMLLISGDYSDYHLLEKMNAREDKYIISQIINYKEGMEKLIPQIDQYDGIIVGDMPSHERNLIIKYCYAKQIRTYSVPKNIGYIIAQLCGLKSVLILHCCYPEIQGWQSSRCSVSA